MAKKSTTAIIALLLLLGAIDAWAGRRSYVAGDTVSYMDIASGLAGGDIRYAVNGHFSSLFAWIIGGLLWLLPSDGQKDFAIARGVSFAVFVAALFIFRDFLNRFLDRLYDRSEPAAGEFAPIPRRAFSVIGYSLFAWGCFSLTMVARISPDLAILGMLFAASSCLLAFETGAVSRARFVRFGAVLGVGYLLKAIFFPVSLMFIAAAAFVKPVWAVRRRLLLTAVTFAVIAAPLATAISLKYHHLTFGDSGRLTYWQFVLENYQTQHWQGEPPGSGTPVHPTRQIMHDPDVFEFATPIVATYAPWYEPTWWNEGIDVHFDLKRQLRAIRVNLGAVAHMMFEDRFSLMALPILAMLLLRFRSCRVSVVAIRRMAPLWLVALGAFGIYVPILIETRYVAGSLPYLGILALSAVEFRDRAAARNFATIAAVLCVLGIALQCGPRLTRAATLIVETGGDVRDDRWLVAEEFNRIGVSPGTPVAAIDQASKPGEWAPAVVMDWARLARVRVVSEIPHADDPTRQFWYDSPERRTEALQALRDTGALYVVASGVPAGADTTGWTQLADSRFFYRGLR